MKKMLCLLAAVALMTATLAGALAEQGNSALDAFYRLTGEKAQVENPETTQDEYLARIMEGAYAKAPADEQEAAAIAPDLHSLAGITTKDIAAYAAARKLSVAQVRNAYYRSLANVLKAEILVNPATEERYRNVQVILSLFLTKDEDEASVASRNAIRRSMTPEHAKTLAADSALPVAFVEFLLMDEHWDDDRWNNDDDWRANAGWDGDSARADGFVKLTVGDKDGAKTSRVAQVQERLIALGYLVGKADGVFGDRTASALKQFQRANGLPATGVFDMADDDRLMGDDVVARWDYQDSFDDSIDDTPDGDNSPDADDSRDRDDSRDGDDSPDATPKPRDDSDDSPDATPKPRTTPKPRDDSDDSPDPTPKPRTTPKPAPRDDSNSPDSPDDSDD